MAAIVSLFDSRTLFAADDCESLRACLEVAVKSRADLDGANLFRADLRGADLAGANLVGANLYRADLRGAKWPHGAVVLRPPLCISGLLWNAMLFGSHLQIGCEIHSVREWESFDDERILRLGSREALEFWRANKVRLLAFRDVESEAQFEAKVNGGTLQPRDASPPIGISPTVGGP